MYKVSSGVWLLLPLLCCALAQNYVEQKDSGYETYSKEEGNHYESNHYEYQHKPYPYHFGYDIKDAKGNMQYHKEEGDEHNVKKGSYGFTDAYGVYRQVDYIADHLGFRAKIRTNEPGTANYHPAHVDIYAEPPPSQVYSNYEKYNHVDNQQADHTSYNQPEHTSYQQAEHTSYQQPEHASYQQPEHASYRQPEHASYQQPEHASYQQPDHASYQQPDHASYQQPDHSSYQQPEHVPYQQVEQRHASYQQPEYPVNKQQYAKSAHVSYGEPDLIKSEQSSPSQQKKYKQVKNHPKLSNQKITYVPVYVANNVAYKIKH